MKIEELRLGNITKQGIVFMIGYDRGILGCWFIKNKYDSFADGFVKADDIEPIPLTPEILEKAGFIFYKLSYGFVADKHEISVFYSDEMDKYYINISDNRVFFEYVHTLQNIFALTGEELEIKL